MSEVWFDTRLGEQLIGEEAVMQRLQEAGPGEVVPLQDLLLGDDFPIGGREFRKQPSAAWTCEDFVALGSATLELFESTGNERILRTRTLNRLQKLGIGPLLNTFIGTGKDFETMQDYNEAIGAAEVGYSTRGKFSNWTTADFVAYAASVEREVGGKPREEDYRQRARHDRDAPTVGVLYASFTGRINELNEHLGYCNVKSWDEDDYIDFGAKCIEVNGLAMFKHSTIAVLSARRRGPGYVAIMRKFGNWNNYRTQVVAEYEERTAASQQVRTEKLARYKALTESSGLPQEYSELPDDKLLFYAGRYLVALAVAPTIRSEQLGRVLRRRSSRSFVNSLLRVSNNPRLTAGHIEITASTLGVYDDLWPMDQYKEYLRVTPQDIAAVNERRNATRRKQWQQRHGTDTRKSAS